MVSKLKVRRAVAVTVAAVVVSLQCQRPPVANFEFMNLIYNLKQATFD